jgi:competence protein ComEC
MIVPYLSALCFLAGVLLSSVFGVPFYSALVLPTLLLLFWKPRIAWPILCLLLGLWRVELFESQQSFPELGFGRYSGVVATEVDRRGDHQKITVETEWGRVLLRVSAYEDVAFNDELEFSGELELPSTDIEGFNYAQYLARYKVWHVMGRPYIAKRLVRPSWRGRLYALKARVEQRLNRLYSEPESSFLAGLLLGSRKGMPDNLADAFQVTGLTHIVAISGYNISLVIALMFGLFSFLKLKTRVWVSSITIILFVILVGGSAAVVRAGLMGVLTLWGLFAGRRSQVFFALLWSALLMVAWNPYILAFDVGFQLSFASTLGLLLFVPILDEKLPKGGGILREAFLLTLAAQLATLPFTALHFGQLSLVSPLANVLVAPFLPMAMLFGALSIVLGWPAALLAQVHLKAVELIALSLSQLPFVQIKFSLSPFGFSFLLLLFLIWVLRTYKQALLAAFGLGPSQ